MIVFRKPFTYTCCTRSCVDENYLYYRGKIIIFNNCMSYYIENKTHIFIDVQCLYLFKENIYQYKKYKSTLCRKKNRILNFYEKNLISYL